MTLPCWIANSQKRRAMIPPARASAARSAVGRPAKRTNGFAPADTNGTRLRREECARRASTSGLRRSASLAADGRRTQNGMFRNALKGGSKHHTAATAETTGYGIATCYCGLNLTSIDSRVSCEVDCHFHCRIASCAACTRRGCPPFVSMDFTLPSDSTTTSSFTLPLMLIF